MKINRRRILIAMAESGMTKKEIAEKANLYTQSLKTILNRGTCEPRTVGKIAKALGVSVAEIMEGDCE